jgi:hypothetical protein
MPMADQLKPLHPEDGPLARFALELRELREAAPRRWENPGTHPETGRLNNQSREIDNLIDHYYLTRPTVYAALAGSRMPQEHNLRAMVEGWTAHLPANEKKVLVESWLKKRKAVLDQLACFLPGRCQNRSCR